MHCLVALVPSKRGGGYVPGKKSEGAVALVPGATLELPIDVRGSSWKVMEGHRTLELPIDVRGSSWKATAQPPDTASSELGTVGGAGSPLACASISHLTSHEGMGVARVSCVLGCTCTPRKLNAHRVAATGSAHARNVSVFEEAKLTLRLLATVPNATATGHRGAALRTAGPNAEHGGLGLCWVRLRVLEETSSGAHKFKVAMVTVSLGGGCE